MVPWMLQRRQVKPPPLMAESPLVLPCPSISTSVSCMPVLPLSDRMLKKHPLDCSREFLITTLLALMTMQPVISLESMTVPAVVIMLGPV